RVCQIAPIQRPQLAAGSWSLEAGNWQLEAFFMRHVPIEDSIDLHAFRPQDVVRVVNENVDAAGKKGLRRVRLINGRGIGVQPAMVQAALEKPTLVESFWD